MSQTNLPMPYHVPIIPRPVVLLAPHISLTLSHWSLGYWHRHIPSALHWHFSTAQTDPKGTEIASFHMINIDLLMRDHYYLHKMLYCTCAVAQCCCAMQPWLRTVLFLAVPVRHCRQHAESRRWPTCLMMAVWASLAGSGWLSPFSVSGLVPSLESVSMADYAGPRRSGRYRFTLDATAAASTPGCLVTSTAKTRLLIALLFIDRYSGGVF